MNVFYLEFADKNHHLLIKKNLELHGWKPTYIVTATFLVPHFKSLFPEAVIDDDRTASLAKTSLELKDNLWPVDSQLLEKSLFIESMYMRMSDRRDFDSFSFSSIERRRHYYKTLSLWNRILEEKQPDLVLFPFSPHTLWDFVAYGLCQIKQIPTLFFASGNIPSRCCVLDKVNFNRTPILDTYKQALKTNVNSFLPEDLDNFFKNKQSNSKDFNPHYMLKLSDFQVKKPTFLIKLFQKVVEKKIKLFNYAWKFFSDRYLFVNHFKYNHAIAGLPLSEIDQFNTLPYLKKLSLTKWKWERNKKKLKRLKNQYIAVSRNPDYGLPYIYVTLHYQPEKTTVPDAFLLSDQYIMIDLLSACLPSGWKLYVKEHPAQLDPNMPAFNVRSKYDYEDYLRNPNVELVSLDCPTFDLIKNSRAVATLTGTVALEAVIQGKSAFVFGYPWFLECEGVFNIKTKESCMKAIELIKNGFEVDVLKVKKYFQAVGEAVPYGFPISYFHEKNPHIPAPDIEANAEVMSKILMKAFQFYYQDKE